VNPNPTASRLTIHLERGQLRLLERETVGMTVPASEPLEAFGTRAGWWAEIRDAAGRVLYRTQLPDPLRREHPTPYGMSTAPRARAADFWITVPVLAGGDHLVLLGSLESAVGPAQVLGRFDLPPDGR
jgi:hypothetical protein